ncbi:MAG: HAMP domain-containing protein [Ignavibacteria bacterium]|nr:HAMP domain-containing protein [Ignavibacteria bacterium]
MKLKTLIFGGYILMAAIIVALSAFSIVFIERLNIASDKILKDNYLSIESVNRMIDNLDVIDNSQAILLSKHKIEKETSRKEYSEAKNNFIKYLFVCEGNITEQGEEELLKIIRKQFEQYVSKIELTDPSISDFKYINELIPDYNNVKSSCYELLKLNELAMLSKSEISKGISRDIEIYMMLIAGLSLLFVTVIISKVPSAVIKPISELTEKVEAISQKKYTERIEVKSNNEVGILARSFNRMAEKLDEYEKSNVDKLIIEKKRAEAIVENMRDAIIVLDENNEVILANKVSLKLLGMTKSDLTGRNVDKIAEKNNLLKNITDSREQKKSEDSENSNNYLRIVFNDKEEFFLKDYTNITDANGKTIGIIIALKNVTGFKELDEIKSGFIATVSHELKTPLAAMNMSLRLIQDPRVGELNKEQKRLTSAMKEEVKRLLKMVNELLNLSKLEAGGEIYKYQEVTVDEIRDASVTPMLMQFEQNKIKFDLKVEQDLPKLKLDVNKIAWVIINLLNNAVRYSKQGGEIKFTVSRENNFIKFSVKDNGVGIKPEYIGKIFQKFVQVNKANLESQYKGVGLGLAIAKEFIEAHKGDIYAASEYGKGSEFVFKLPV